MDISIKILDQPDEMATVEELQQEVWPGSDRDIVPGHILLAIARNGGLVIGAYSEGRLIGFLCGFAGFEEGAQGKFIKHVSHELAVLPEFRSQNVGFMLKRAQWQMVRHQNVELISWTYDPLLSTNARLNVAKLGGVSRRYIRNYYGDMRDGLNRGLESDRFVLEWWVNSRRVENRLGKKKRPTLDLAHYLGAGVFIINPSHVNNIGLPEPMEGFVLPDLTSTANLATSGQGTAMFLIEIPSDFPAIRRHDIELAFQWRVHSRTIFEGAFSAGFLVTDFIYLPGNQPRSFYVLSQGDATL